MAAPSGRRPQPAGPGGGSGAGPGALRGAEEDAEGLYVAVERCPLCNTTRRRLTCAKCVQSGDFVFFDGRDSESVLKAMEGKEITDQLRWKIMSCKMRIEQLKQTICKENDEMTRRKGRVWDYEYTEGLLRIKEENQKHYRRAQRHQEKKEKIQRHNKKLGDLVEKKTYELKTQYEHLANLRRTHILELTSVIFPIEEVKTSMRDPADVSSESDNAMTSSTVSKLAEARRTTYLSGRWVCDDHNGDTSISITGPWIILPNNGDYSAYYSWVEEKKTTQGPDLLHPLHTLRNLMYLVSPDTENLGRSGPFEISADLEDSMEFVEPSAAGETDESGDEHVSDEETDLGTDWENLPSPRFCDIPSQQVEMLQSQSTQASQPIASSSAGGMISSAPPPRSPRGSRPTPGTASGHRGAVPGTPPRLCRSQPSPRRLSSAWNKGKVRLEFCKPFYLPETTVTAPFCKLAPCSRRIPLRVSVVSASRIAKGPSDLQLYFLEEETDFGAFGPG
ncbi:hypothetical protein DUI87_24782 [Hirundo rustica rustica]|uniref:Uncharacterized protein n=1 Tax=Hirundo rustica rustica TaxID=333673 RepID=A0A3M0JUG0_HIRRU|nr:hypothetical protein DUI87_24782 [Hirundo rustica rustica]